MLSLDLEWESSAQTSACSLEVGVGPVKGKKLTSVIFALSRDDKLFQIFRPSTSRFAGLLNSYIAIEAQISTDLSVNERRGIHCYHSICFQLSM